MNSNHFEDSTEFGHRLMNSIIMYNGLPYMVASVNTGGVPNAKPAKTTLGLCKLPLSNSNKLELVPAIDEGLNWINYNIGYCNNYKTAKTYEALYLTRRPVRQFIQGLVDGVIYDNGSNYINFNSLTHLNGFAAMLANVYPSLNQAHAMLMAPYDQDIDKRRLTSVGFDRRFALGYSPDTEAFTLEYRGRVIGSSSNPAKGFHLAKKHEQLRELIETVGIHLKVA